MRTLQAQQAEIERLRAAQSQAAAQEQRSLAEKAALLRNFSQTPLTAPTGSSSTFQVSTGIPPAAQPPTWYSSSSSLQPPQQPQQQVSSWAPQPQQQQQPQWTSMSLGGVPPPAVQQPPQQQPSQTPAQDPEYQQWLFRKNAMAQDPEYARYLEHKEARRNTRGQFVSDRNTLYRFRVPGIKKPVLGSAADAAAFQSDTMPQGAIVLASAAPTGFDAQAAKTIILNSELADPRTHAVVLRPDTQAAWARVGMVGMGYKLAEFGELRKCQGAWGGGRTYVEDD
jgi:hypothetical protein